MKWETHEMTQSGSPFPEPSRTDDASREIELCDAGFREISEEIPSGLKLGEEHELAKGRILDVLNGTEEQWRDHRWQLSNLITDLDTLKGIVNLSRDEYLEIEKVGRHYRWSVSPYYASLMDRDDPGCPIRMQALPTIRERFDTVGKKEPLVFTENNPAPLITRLYHDRLIIKLTNMCSVFCRHCQRKKDIDSRDVFHSMDSIKGALDYIREHEEIRDVLLTGGDALALSDRQLDWILTELDAIDHVEIKRIGSRMPCVLPQRITPELCSVLENHDPVYLNTQFNHPKEVTREARKAVDMLTRSGVIVRDQTVLLRGVNDDPGVMKKLMQELLRIKVVPYYLFLCKRVRGIMHFCTSVDKGLAIIEQLQGYTSGMAVPRLITHVPDGRGKVPVYPRTDPKVWE
jgi:lysine 2,3-aminomutase